VPRNTVRANQSDPAPQPLAPLAYMVGTTRARPPDGPHTCRITKRRAFRRTSHQAFNGQALQHGQACPRRGFGPVEVLFPPAKLAACLVLARQTGKRPLRLGTLRKNEAPLQLINQQKLGITHRFPLTLRSILAQTLQISDLPKAEPQMRRSSTPGQINGSKTPCPHSNLAGMVENGLCRPSACTRDYLPI